MSIEDVTTLERWEWLCKFALLAKKVKTQGKSIIVVISQSIVFPKECHFNLKKMETLYEKQNDETIRNK